MPMTESLPDVQESIPEAVADETEEQTENAEKAEEETESRAEEAPRAEEKDADELASLRAEVARLREELVEKDGLYQAELARARELAEFALLFPDVPPSDLPDEVQKSAQEKGIPLAAAFALYEKKREAEERRTRAVNHRNAGRAPGRAGTGTAEEFFTPDDVRRMSPHEVRVHFKTIKESMKKWN